MSLNTFKLGIERKIGNYDEKNSLIEGKEFGVIGTFTCSINYIVVNGIVINSDLTGCNIAEALEKLYNRGMEGYYLPNTFIQNMEVISRKEDDIERSKDNLKYIKFNRRESGSIMSSHIDPLYILNQLNNNNPYNHGVSVYDNELIISFSDESRKRDNFTPVSKSYITSNYGFDALYNNRRIKNEFDENMMALLMSRAGRFTKDTINWGLVPKSFETKRLHGMVERGSFAQYKKDLLERENQNVENNERNQFGYCKTCIYCNRNDCDKFKGDFNYGKMLSILEDLEYIDDYVNESDRVVIQRYKNYVNNKDCKPYETLHLIEELVSEYNLRGGMRIKNITKHVDSAMDEVTRLSAIARILNRR